MMRQLQGGEKTARSLMFITIFRERNTFQTGGALTTQGSHLQDLVRSS